jgi:hypothetical protein
VSTLETIMWITSLVIFIYFVFYSLATFGLIALSLVEVALVRVERGELFTPPVRLHRPGISLIAPPSTPSR